MAVEPGRQMDRAMSPAVRANHELADGRGTQKVASGGDVLRISAKLLRACSFRKSRVSLSSCKVS